jgi:hypothetical protein
MSNIIKLVGHQRMIEGKHGPFVYNHHDHYVGMALELYGEYSEHEFEVPPVFRLPKGGFHATSFSCCCSLSQFSRN